MGPLLSVFIARNGTGQIAVSPVEIGRKKTVLTIAIEVEREPAELRPAPHGIGRQAHEAHGSSRLDAQANDLEIVSPGHRQLHDRVDGSAVPAPVCGGCNGIGGEYPRLAEGLAGALDALDSTARSVVTDEGASGAVGRPRRQTGSLDSEYAFFRVGAHDLDCGHSARDGNREVGSLGAPRTDQIRQTFARSRVELEVGRRPHHAFSVQSVLNDDFITTLRQRLRRFDRLRHESAKRDRLTLRAPRRR